MIVPSALMWPAGIVIGDSEWIAPAIAVAVAGILLVLLVNRHRLVSTGLATVLRVTGWLLISACLVNPLWSSARPRQGANVFAVVVDNSRSQNVVVEGTTTRAESIQGYLEQGERVEGRGWLQRMEEDFEVRRYTLNDFVQPTPRFVAPEFDGASTRLIDGLQQLVQRYRGQPLAGILLVTDGNATDPASSMDFLQDGPPIYPVIDKSEDVPADLGIQSVRVSQSAFDDAPVSLWIQLAVSGSAGDNIRATVLDAAGTPLESQSKSVGDDSPVRIDIRPEQAGTVFYEVRTELRDEDGTAIEEATTVNNSRLVAVDRGSEPRRILYVSGRPNWEFKFLRRAIDTDPQIELVGLIRIARKEAKFEFRAQGERANSLFRGFDEAEQEVAEDYDEPVLVRLGTKDKDELVSGFPLEAAELFAFDALILDDVESAFFTADQQQLIREFVTKRGGGFLMLGGQESFRRGEYDRTPIGELLPLDLRREATAVQGPLRLKLTREGWLQPWVRLRTDEESERSRLLDMPTFETLNPAVRVRPGAQVMASVSDEAGQEWPALVVQRFGRGRSAAMCIGDLWRWRMDEGRRTVAAGLSSGSGQAGEPWDREPSEDRGDYSRAARQMVRWLVSDVPRRLTVSSTPAPEEGVHTWRVSAAVRDEQFVVREDAQVVVKVTRPDGTTFEQRARPSDDELGRYDTVITAAESGAWICEVTASLEEDGDEFEELTATHGWASQPDQQEMARAAVNGSLLNSVAENSRGRVIDWGEIDGFVDALSSTEAPVMEVRSWPIWHQWSVFVAALVCFVGDWGIRRRLGYP